MRCETDSLLVDAMRLQDGRAEALKARLEVLSEKKAPSREDILDLLFLFCEVSHGCCARDSINHPNMPQMKAKIAYKVILIQLCFEMKSRMGVRRY
jgi:hypothetical protein